MKRNLNLNVEDLKELKSILKKYVPNKEVWAYGSRVSGHCHEGSDLDLVVRNTNVMTPVENLSSLKQAFIDSDLPVLIDVMDWASLPEEYRDEIKKNYVVIQSGSA